MKIKCVPIEGDMRQDRKDKCRRCLVHYWHCQRQSKTDSCTSCIEKGLECTNDYSGLARQPKEKVSKPKLLKEEKCHACHVKRRLCSHERPCPHCITREIECKPYKSRTGVSLEEKCSRCFKRTWACDGKDPCDKCLRDKLPCIPQALVDNPKCNRCRCNKLGCDKKRPCNRCIKDKRPCGYYDNDNLVRRLYATDETKFLEEDKDECVQCLAYKRHCSGTEPCHRCVKTRETNCTWNRKGGLTEYFKVEPFKITEENAVEFDPSRPLPKKKEDKRTHPEADTESKVPKRGESSVKAGKRPRKPETSDDEEHEDLEGDESLDEYLPDDEPLDEDLPDDEPLDEDLTDPSSFKYAGAVISSKMTLREPRSYKEAMNLPDAEKWHEATELEMQSIITNNVFEVVDLPQGKRAISTRWVYKRKLGPDGEILKHKARLVARGFQQREGIDFNETFSGVVKPGSYRILFALTAILGWVSHQMDVKTAFLNADMQEEVYVNPPNPYALSKRQVWKMLRVLYGFKQSPRAWYEKLSSRLITLGFRVSSYD